MAFTRSSCEVREEKKKRGGEREEREQKREFGVIRCRRSLGQRKKEGKKQNSTSTPFQNPRTSNQKKKKTLSGYFSQFGAVTRVRLSRVKKTGKPKSYAFLEFANPAVAAIAADAMDGYLMFSQRLSVKVLAPEAVHSALFKGANRVFTKVPWRQLEAKRANRRLTPEGAARRRARAARADAKRAERIERSGIDYKYERLLESILGEKEEGPKAKKVAAAAAAAGGRKTKAAAAEAAPAKKAKTAAAAEAPKATAAAAAAAAKKKPAAAKKAAAPAVAAKKSKRELPAASTAGTRSSKRARG